MTSSSDTGGRVRQRWRQRELASDRRAGSWARRKARTAQHRYVRAHWRLLLTALLAMLSPVVLAALLIPSTEARFFLLGAGMTGTFAVLVVWVMQVTGTAPAMMGDLAEQWTASELRGLCRSGGRLVNQLALRPWDIDHVLIGPWGALVVETKWSATPWTLSPPDERVRRAANQARANARDLRLWGRSRATGLAEVRPVVMLWGPGSSQLEVTYLDDVTIVPGPLAKTWREQLGGTRLTGEQVDAAWSLLEQQARARDTGAELMPPSALQLAATAAGTATASGASFLLAAWLLAPLRSLYGWAAACVCLAALAQPLRARKHSRLPALAWQTGLLAMVAVAGLALLLA